MPCYLVALGNVANPDALAAYGKAVGPVLEQYGARRLARADATRLEGEGSGSMNQAVLLEFDDRAALERFWNSDAYQSVKHLRTDVAVFDIWAIG